jgi:hypothetical protein
LVSSQSFPHLWKKLWKFQKIHACAQFLAGFFARSQEGEGGQGRKIDVFGVSIPLKARKTALPAGRKPTEADFL